MTLNHTHLVHRVGQQQPQQPQRTLIPKHSIYEADFSTQPQLTSDATTEEGRFWKGLVEARDGVEALNGYFSHQQHSDSPHSIHSQSQSKLTFDKQTVKAQVSRGEGGCFPRECRRRMMMHCVLTYVSRR
jgi:hypothetical protein